jgi:hypothetical protein
MPMLHSNVCSLRRTIQEILGKAVVIGCGLDDAAWHTNKLVVFAAGSPISKASAWGGALIWIQ